MYRRFGKRVLDIFGAGLLCLITLPLQVVVATLVRAKFGSPVVFAQERAGQEGRPFRVHKFRTMTEETGCDGNLLSDAERLTPLGQFLRSTSLDELPGLVDVIRGAMSLVGPRPLLLSYLDRYTPRQARRHEVRPGITGLAQVSGRNALPWEERLELDVVYVDNVSFLQDLRILLKTVVKVVRRVDVSGEGLATGSEFSPTTTSVQPQGRNQGAREGLLE